MRISGLVGRCNGKVGAADQTVTAFEDFLEYRLRVLDRVGIDLQHFGSGGLAFQGLFDLGRASLHFIKSLRVAKGDHSLRGEGFQQCDLLRAERAGFGVTQSDDTNRFFVLDKRHAKG